MAKIKEMDIYTTNEGYDVIVVKYISYSKVLVKFLDFEYSLITQSGHILTGSIKNPYHRRVEGVGYMGIGINKSKIKSKDTKVYKTWGAMFSRCYNARELAKNPSYVGCSVAPEWHNFQNFAEWFEDNYIEGYHLDKDILVKGNKIYSPDTCCFVPARINTLFINCKTKRGNLPIGVIRNYNKYVAKIGKSYIGSYHTAKDAFNAYKIYKENLIKSIAIQYFEKDLITEKVYKSLMNWTICITD